MNINSDVCKNIKALRKARRLTLDAAAAATGVSRSMLAQIERGDANPTLSVLWRIANGYKVSFSSLTERHGESSTVIRAGDITPIPGDGGRYLNYPAFPFDERHLFETYRIMIEPGGCLRAEAHLAGAEEFITVFSGETEITAGEAVFALGTGDSLRFMADVPHTYRNTGAETAALAMLIYYNR